MVAGVDQCDAFTRDMGYSVTEFFRILPTAIDGYQFAVDGGRVVIRPETGGRELVLCIKELPERRIGMIRIPRIEVDFSFHDFTDAQRVKFLASFDRSFQRGGG